MVTKSIFECEGTEKWSFVKEYSFARKRSAIDLHFMSPELTCSIMP
jgi:hypothetical protein